MSEKKYILSAETAQRKLERMAYEIAEQNTTATSLILAGVKDNGYDMAQQLKGLLQKIITIPIELLAIGLDKRRPMEVTLDRDIELDQRSVIVIDDVANSGKTLLYALKPLLKKSPLTIQTLVLVDRAHKVFPVKPDYVGISLATTLHEHIFVGVENGAITGAWME